MFCWFNLLTTVDKIYRPMSKQADCLPDRERNVLFNDALNTFYLRLCGVRHMVKDHSDSERDRDRNVLFNDALNTFYIRLYGVRHMVKDHSDSEKGNLLPPHRLLLSINSKGSFICTIPHKKLYILIILRVQVVNGKYCNPI